VKIIELNDWYFSIEPENTTESNKLSKFPGFQRFKGKYLIPKKPEVIRNLIERFKKIHKDPISVTEAFVNYMKASPELSSIPEDFEWFNPPYPHQELALRFLYTHGSAGLLLEPGLGKTFVVLNYIKLANFKKSLIICPRALLFVWEDEVAEHRPDIKVHVMESTSWKDKILNANTRLAKWERKLSEEDEDSDAYKRARTNVMSCRRELVKLPELRDEDLRKADEADLIVINYEKVSGGLEYLNSIKFDFVAIDEGLIKSMATARTKSIHKLCSKIPYRVIMSGTLINNGPLDIYSPVKLIEPSLVGGGYGAFEHHYARIARTAKGRRFVAGVGKRQTEEIRDILRSCSIVMTKDEWLDLPDKNFHRIKVPMSSHQTELYDTLKSNHICQIEGYYISVNNPLTVSCYLNQIANGFLYVYDSIEDDDFADLFDDYEEVDKGARSTIFIESGKKDVLRSLILDQLNNKKFILWYNMQAEYEQICAVLEDMGVEFLSIRGGSKDTGQIVHKFNKSGSIQVLVAQSQSVNYGITVLGKDPEELEKLGVEVLPDFDTSVSDHVFWSLGWSLERYTQQQDRSHRIGQKNECDYWILATDCGIEDLVWERLDKKESIRKSILVDYINN
jgi:SNF2 family DNA or RNA helicase